MTRPLIAPAGLDSAVAVVTPGGPPVTYADLRARSSALADRLSAAGLGPGDRVATVTQNSIDQVVLFFACAEAGLVLAPLSWRAAPAELTALLDATDPVLLATDPAYGPLARRAAAGRDVRLVSLGPGGLERSVPRAADPVARTEPCADAPVLLLFTSGSSGSPKGVALSTANCVATNGSLDARFPMTAEDTVLLVLPQFHVGAWNVQPLLAWSRGARVVVCSGFDPAIVLATIERERVTAMMGVPTVYSLLAAHPDFARRDLSSLHTALVGGAPVDAGLGESWAARGVRLWSGYGLTEAGPNVLCEPPQAPIPADGWLVPYDGVDVRLTSEGELLVRGAGVFGGYWHEPGSSRAALPGGWLATGDIAEQSDSGAFRLRGRRSEMYISGGENIHPAEIEHALCGLDSIAEAAVVGVPDQRWGEVGRAFVVPTPGARLDPDTASTQLRAHLAGFKIPRDIVVLDALPLTGSGKVDRRSLRAPSTERGLGR